MFLMFGFGGRIPRENEYLRIPRENEYFRLLSHSLSGQRPDLQSRPTGLGRRLQFPFQFAQVGIEYFMQFAGHDRVGFGQ